MCSVFILPRVFLKFPSLHTAVNNSIVQSIFLTGNTRFIYFGVFVMVTVIISVLYLSIHYILDVIGGIIVAPLAISLSKKNNWVNNYDSVYYY